MRTTLLISLLLSMLASGFASGTMAAKEYAHRWFYVSTSLGSDGEMEKITLLVKEASLHGYTGMALAAGLDMLDLQSPEYIHRLDSLKAVCDRKGIEIVPVIFSVGYGSAVLAHDRNMAAGSPVKDALFAAHDGAARLIPDPPVEIENGGFERFRRHRFRGWRFQDMPGRISFVDTDVSHSGHASLRLESFGAFTSGMGRVLQIVRAKPGRCYRIDLWVKTEGLEPNGSFRVIVLGPDGRDLAPWVFDVDPTMDWKRLSMGFNSMSYDKVNIYIGVWGGERGKVWVDDVSIEEVGLLNILRRPGTPILVKSEKTGVVYEEGRDFAPIEDHRLDFRFDHEAPSIELLPGSRIEDGERLRVSYYHGMAVNRGQVSVCMSEPKLYEIWKRQARLIQRYLSPSKYFLDIDEVRAGGSCRACKARETSMGEILGDCITRAVDILHEVNPQAQVFIWSDMLDPEHNARNNYFLVDGDLEGSWNYVPNELVIVCWNYDKRMSSLSFFSSHGFKTMAAAYYDAGSLSSSRKWLEALDETPAACGIMYTTWREKYELLGPFGEMVNQHSRLRRP